LKNRVNLTLGCFTLFVIVAIFSIEGVLTLLRQRNISATLELHSLNPAATAAVAATPTAAPGSTPVANLAILTITPDTTLVVHAKWDYRIGPRFPDTVIRAVVTDSATGKVVASDENTILCGPETIQCDGEYQLTPAYGVIGKTGTASNWPVGSYSIAVTSSIADLKATDLLRQSFIVKAAS
jgi:hypothetical protein